MKTQRLRLSFCRAKAAADISLRATMSAWEQAIRQSGLPLAYSEGKRSTAQISIAAPLPVGVTSSCELVDVWMAERVDLSDFLERVNAGLPPGLAGQSVREIGAGLPSLQSQVRWAEYEVDVPVDDRTRGQVESSIEQLLTSTSLPWEQQGESGVRRYDLRLLVLDVWIEGEDQKAFRLGMRLRADQQGSGRPEQVTAALGFGDPPRRIHRRRLYIEEVLPSVEAYRRLGEPEGT